MERNFQPGDLVQHFKRGLLTPEELAREPEKYLYDIVGAAEHTETGEALMVYRPRYGERKLYARPLAMFCSPVDREKYPEARQEYRFEAVGSLDVQRFWDAVLRQDAEALRQFFLPDAYVNWPCTNEHFTVEEFIRANCEYPGQWDGVVERVEQAGCLVITATKVVSKESGASFHAVSFITARGGKIAAMEEYWGDDGPAPQWRQEKRIGTPIA